MYGKFLLIAESFNFILVRSFLLLRTFLHPRFWQTTGQNKETLRTFAIHFDVKFPFFFVLFFFNEVFPAMSRFFTGLPNFPAKSQFSRSLDTLAVSTPVLTFLMNNYYMKLFVPLRWSVNTTYDEKSNELTRSCRASTSTHAPANPAPLLRPGRACVEESS